MWGCGAMAQSVVGSILEVRHTSTSIDVLLVAFALTCATLISSVAATALSMSAGSTLTLREVMKVNDTSEALTKLGAIGGFGGSIGGGKGGECGGEAGGGDAGDPVRT